MIVARGTKKLNGGSDILFNRWRNKRVKNIAGSGYEINDGKLTLAQMTRGEKAAIVFVPEQSLLPSLGLRLGKKLKVRGWQYFGGPVVIEIEGRNVAVGRVLAQQIELALE